jgi:hypothetical protein
VGRIDGWSSRWAGVAFLDGGFPIVRFGHFSPNGWQFFTLLEAWMRGDKISDLGCPVFLHGPWMKSTLRQRRCALLNPLILGTECSGKNSKLWSCVWEWFPPRLYQPYSYGFRLLDVPQLAHRVVTNATENVQTWISSSRY